jgi:N-acetylmuramoyl-L-alanine amidase
MHKLTLLALVITIIFLCLPTPAAHTEDSPDPPRIVAIIPGHGGAESGAVHRDAAGRVDLIEKNVNLSIALKLAFRLEAAGYIAVLTRDGDYSLTANPSDAEREIEANLDVANVNGADILISIHNNGHADPSLSGTETYYCPERAFAGSSLLLARSIQKHLVSGFRDVMGYHTRDRGVRSANYKPYGCLYTLGGDRGGTFRASAMPGVLVESLFVTHDYEAWILSQDAGQDLIATAIFDGIDEYFSSNIPSP